MPDLQPVFDKLRPLLAIHSDTLEVVKDDPGYYYLHTGITDDKGKEISFGMVKIGARKVSFHLLPVYDHPELLNGISDALKGRMQGKSCFNFTKYDEELFNELGQLTKKGLKEYRSLGKA